MKTEYKEVIEYRRRVYLSGRFLAAGMTCVGTLLCVFGLLFEELSFENIIVFCVLGGFLAVVGILGWFGIKREMGINK